MYATLINSNCEICPNLNALCDKLDTFKQDFVPILWVSRLNFVTVFVPIWKHCATLEGLWKLAIITGREASFLQLSGLWLLIKNEEGC